MSVIITTIVDTFIKDKLELNNREMIVVWKSGKQIKKFDLFDANSLTYSMHDVSGT